MKEAIIDKTVSVIIRDAFGDFPILRVGTRHHYPDEDLAGFGSGDVNVADDFLQIKYIPRFI
jgi:hypothetical protein